LANKKIIAGNILNLTDARYFAAQEVDFLLFDLDEVDIQTIVNIKEWVSGPEVLLSLGKVSLNNIEEAIIRISPKAIGCDKEMFDRIQYLRAHTELFYIQKEEEEIIKWDQETYTSNLEDGMTNAYTGMIIKGGEESKVGVKSFEDLEDIFEAIKNSRE
jgi:hypothetical protein